MSEPSSAEVILSQAGEREREYDWLGAAESYEKALGMMAKQDLDSLGEIHERIGYCFYRAAFQAETHEEFKSRMQLATDHYEDGAELFGSTEETETRAQFNNCKAMATHAKSWLASNSSAKKEQLNESWRFEKEALKLYEKTADRMNVGKICNNFMILLADRLNIEWDAESRENIIEQALECGESAIEIFSKAQDRRQLAQAYIITAYFYRNAAFAKGLKAEKREECREKALSYPQKAIDLSRESADSYAIGLSNLCLANARLDILGTAGLEEVQYYEKALRCGKLMKDKLVIADALFGLLYVTNNNAKALEDPDKAREEYAKLDKYWENAVHYYSIIAYNFGVAMACFQMITTMRDRSRLETDLENKRQLLEKSIEVGYKGLSHAHLSGSLAPTFHITLSLGKVILPLARIENDTDRKKNLLNESSRYIEQSIGILKQASAVSLVEPREVNLAFNVWTLAVNQVELAKVEEDVSIKIKILVKSISNAKTAYDFWLEWIRSPWANVERPFWSIMGAYEIETGKTLNQLYELTDDSTFLEKGVEAFNRSVDAYERANLPTRVAEAYWQVAKAYNRLTEYSKSAKNFELASQNYKLAAGKIPQLKEFYADYAIYMQAWNEIEKARNEHKKEEYRKAEEHYENAAELHNTTERWKYLAPNYLAWARLDEAENLSREEKTGEAKNLFQQADKLFAEAKKSVQAKLEKVETKDEKELLVNLVKATEIRREYCLARMALEEAKNLDRQGDHYSSSGKYGLAIETFEKITKAVESEQDKKELKFIVSLSRAWQKMTRAEAEASPALYIEASQLFEEAKGLSPNEKTRLLALGHSHFCRALEAGTKFADNRDVKDHTIAIQHLESAIGYYMKADFQVASEYAKATKLLFDAYVHMDNAAKESDPEKKAKLYMVVEKILQKSSDSYIKAENPAKSEHVLKLLETVREDRELAVSLTEVLYTPIIVSTAAFPAPTPTHEKAVGLEKFESAEIQANIITHQKELHIGDNLDLEIELVNTGKNPALLTKITEVAPEGFEIIEKPEMYRVEDSYLNMKGKQLNPLKTEEIRLVLKPKVRGVFLLKPRILYLDENGKDKSHEPEPITITVKELGIKGWLKGER